MKIFLSALLSTMVMIATTHVQCSQAPSLDINWGEKLLEFKKFSKDNKLEWFDFVKKNEINKIDLLKKHTAEWFDFHLSTLTQWKTTPITTQADKENLFKQHLEKAIEIRKKHATDWKELCENMQQQGKDTFVKQNKQLENFENSFKPKAEAPLQEESEENEPKEEDNE